MKKKYKLEKFYIMVMRKSPVMIFNVETKSNGIHRKNSAHTKWSNNNNNDSNGSRKKNW